MMEDTRSREVTGEVDLKYIYFIRLYGCMLENCNMVQMM